MEENPLAYFPMGGQTELSYTCYMENRRQYCRLCPGTKRSNLAWSFCELLAFVSELQEQWKIHDAGRLMPPSHEYPDGYFRFTCDCINYSGLSYALGIKITVPTRCTHCCVSVCRSWVDQPSENWSCEMVPEVAKSERPRSAGHGAYSVTKHICRRSTLAVLSGQPILRFEPGDTSPFLLYLVRFLSYAQNTNNLSANPHKQLYVQRLNYVMTPRNHEPGTHIQGVQTVLSPAHPSASPKA
jgi:hypothetical protein